MKKMLSILTAAAMLLSLAACGATATSTADAASDAASDAADDADAAADEAEAPADDAEEDAPVPGNANSEGYKVAIVQQLDHASLDEIRAAVEAELDAKAAELGVEIVYDEYQGQNDQTILNQIGTQVAEGGYDAVIPIATLAATTMLNATEGSMPIIYAAISDPASADLTGIDYVTGTSDALNTASLLDMMLAVDPDVKTVGLLYSKSEINSQTPIAEAKEYLDAAGIDYIEATGNDNGEVLTAVASLIGNVDAVFTPTDNVVMAAAGAVGEELAKAGIPFYAGADSFVTAGGFATCGVNYTDLGTYTADMTVDIMQGGDVPEYHVMEGGIITVNTEVAEQLGIDYSVFNEMGEVVEVVTTVEEDAAE